VAGGSSALPSAASIEELTGMLLGRKVKTKLIGAIPSSQFRAAATYVEDTGNLAFVVTTCMACLAGVGAALALIPPGMVQEAVKTGKPSEMSVENAYEVFNVASSLFNTMSDATKDEVSAVHVKIGALTIGPLDPKLAAKIAKPIARVDYDINITGYPDGKLSVFQVATGN
jgi:hypothetical protein